MKEIHHKVKQIPEVHPIPDLVEIQRRSYEWFLTEGLRDLLVARSFLGKRLQVELLDGVVP